MKLLYLFLIMIFIPRVNAQSEDSEVVEIASIVEGERLFVSRASYYLAAEHPEKYVQEKANPIFSVRVADVVVKETDFKSLQDFNKASEALDAAAVKTLRQDDEKNWRLGYVLLFHLKSPAGGTIWIGWYERQETNYGKSTKVPVAITGGGQPLKLAPARQNSAQYLKTRYYAEFLTDVIVPASK